MSEATILVTGGAGYIGAHTTCDLVSEGYRVVSIDNFANSEPAVIPQLQKICGNRLFKFVESDVRDINALDNIFKKNKIETVLHFAGNKIIDDSFLNPVNYYDNNIGSTINLIRCMNKARVKRLVFSSSAAVYGKPSKIPVGEDSLIAPLSPYGRTKYMCESILQDVRLADPDWSITILRYFNPVGAHLSGLIGEPATSKNTNLMPEIIKVALGQKESLQIFGNDYNTPDGTAIRDYIHITDLAKGHTAAIQHLNQANSPLVLNLGSGNGISVKQMVDAFMKTTGKDIPVSFAPRRKGDVEICYADPTQAHQTLGWKTLMNLEAMCSDTWRWSSRKA